MLVEGGLPCNLYQRECLCSAYVRRPRASQEATLYTNSVERLGELVSRSHGNSSALEASQKIGVKPQLINHLASRQGPAV